ncbi:hypothetical protein JG676_08615 [Campylobacter sp. 2018MI35]|uniref:hypothetical protein n=1 Tax=Campylobacter sp. 2018MI34 TaxID=2800582 RepID=UPI0019033756|nr:hypothetical protein [Campylobacter sp. 2018MI34]MBK1992646.1 hypothetical protein [Campylobacter sp. 2018MI34]
MSEYRKTYALAERQRFGAMLIDNLGKLSDEIDKAAKVLDRPGGQSATSSQHHAHDSR